MLVARKAAFILNVFLLSLLPPALAFAAKGGSSNSLQAEGGIGLPVVSLQNPDSSFAHYSGIALAAKGVVPVVRAGAFAASLVAGLRYLDLKNTANTDIQSEFSSQLGPSFGLRLHYGKLYLGYETVYMLARHYTVGPSSRATQYEYNPNALSAGVSFPLGTLSLGISYTMTTATISGSAMSLSADVPYTDTLLLLNLTWSTGSDFFKFTSDLFSAK